MVVCTNAGGGMVTGTARGLRKAGGRPYADRSRLN